MKLTLTRTECGAHGQFSVLADPDSEFTLHTCEHTYDDGSGCWAPKIPAGTYTCVLGTHALSDGVPFRTYEITGVAGHSGLLFHCGNTEGDSEGCVLLGLGLGVVDGLPAVVSSRTAFSQFIAHTGGAQTFMLEVLDEQAA